MNNNFRVLIFVGLIFTFSFLASCIGEDKEDEAIIVGTWNFDSYNLTEATINGQPSITYLTSTLGLSAQQAQLIQTIFLSQIVDQEELAKTTFTFNPDGTYIIRDDGVEEDSGSYSFQNNNTRLILTSSDGNQEFDISGLTNNRMVLVLEESELYDVNTDGTDENIEFTIELTLVK